MTRQIAIRLTAIFVALFVGVSGSNAQASDRARIEAFLKTTGFDVAIESISLAAENAPDMLGMESRDFGIDWRIMSKQVFDPELMLDRAIGLLEPNLSDELLTHASAFYASDLGLRLVEVENESHFADDEEKLIEGQALVGQMMAEDNPRLETLERMNHAIDPNNVAPRAVQEIQIRFLLAASYAEVIQLRVDEDGLRALMKENEAELQAEMMASSLASAAYTYRSFSDEDLSAYADALEHPDMQTVYELMNAVHFEVMMNRFEVLAARLGELNPVQDL